MNRLSLIGLSAAVGMTLAAFPAGAVVIYSQVKQNAAGACQGALPAFAGTLRARPLALQNEGGSTAFASCSLVHSDYNGESSVRMGLRVINNTASSVTINCTGVAGYAGGTPLFSAQSVVVSAGGLGSIAWDAEDFSEVVITSPNISCALPPGTGIGYVYHYYYRQVGN